MEHEGQTEQALLSGVTADSLLQRRQRWLRLPPECPSTPSPPSTMCCSVTGASCSCSRDPSCLEDHSQDKNTPQKITEFHRGTQSAWVKTRSGESETRHGRKTVSHRAQGLFFYIFPAQYISFFFIHKHSQMAVALWCKRWSITRLPLRQETGLPGAWVRSQTVLQLKITAAVSVRWNWQLQTDIERQIHSMQSSQVWIFVFIYQEANRSLLDFKSFSLEIFKRKVQ